MIDFEDETNLSPVFNVNSLLVYNIIEFRKNNMLIYKNYMHGKSSMHRIDAI